MINDITLYIFKNLVIDYRLYAGDCIIDYEISDSGEISYRIFDISLFKNNDPKTRPLSLDCTLPFYKKIFEALVAERSMEIRKVIMNELFSAQELQELDD